jgi:hypothetical protein
LMWDRPVTDLSPTAGREGGRRRVECDSDPLYALDNIESDRLYRR